MAEEPVPGFSIVSRTDVGRVRKSNQDALIIGYGAAGVADGIQAVKHMFGSGTFLGVGSVVVEGNILIHLALDVADVETLIESHQSVVQRGAADASGCHDDGAGFDDNHGKDTHFCISYQGHPGLFYCTLEGEFAVGHHRAVHRISALAVDVEHVNRFAVHLSVDGTINYIMILVAAAAHQGDNCNSAKDLEYSFHCF